ncbi:hypothetical protein HPB52_023586 [Rhipicephalus sanguineus]|uniref:SLC41A/MgtE integral membrane domain-containing protein n=1 Tax=Rhipicephalus sanguineus TaxID=34632 RepID=A0A9D4SVA3_RHISA|nr:hypothetical protein HPB52_023586 [Rhipicephalus sanguineus]
MTTVVLVARRCGLNPDNVAAPIAASLGDLTTLTLLSTISSRLLDWKDSPLMTPGVVLLSLLLLPVWFFLAFKHENTRSVLKVGWPPILAAVMVSSSDMLAAVGGNLAAIYCCRLSTFLSRRVEMGVLPPEDASRCANPLVLFAGSSEVGRVARILLLVVIPGQLIFLTATDLLRYGSFNVTPLFGFLYVLVALVQRELAWDTRFGSVHADHIGSMSQPGSCLPDTLSVPAAYKRHERDLRRSEDFVTGLRERTGLVAGDRRSGKLWKSRTPATAECFGQ